MSSFGVYGVCKVLRDSSSVGHLLDDDRERIDHAECQARGKSKGATIGEQFSPRMVANLLEALDPSTRFDTAIVSY